MKRRPGRTFRGEAPPRSAGGRGAVERNTGQERNAPDPVEAEFLVQLKQTAGMARRQLDALKDFPKPVRAAFDDWVSGFVRTQQRMIQAGLAVDSVDDTRKPIFTPFGRRGQYQWPISSHQRVVYPTDKVTFRTLYEMVRDDSQVDFCMAVLKAPIYSANWSFASESKEIADWCNKNLRRSWDSYCDASLLALDYGYIPVELIYGVDEDGYTTIEEFNDLDPSYAWARQDFRGKVVGIRQQYGGEKVEVPPGKFFVYTYQERHGWVYGRARTRSAWPAWWAKRYVIQFMNLWAERFALPWFKVLYPPYQIPTGMVNGAPSYSDPASLAMQKANAIRGQSAVAIPYVSRDGKTREFDVEVMQSGSTGGGTQPYQSILETLDGYIAKSILVPALAFEKPDTGTQGLGISQTHRLSDQLNSICRDQKGIIEPIYNRLVKWNFGPDAPSVEWNVEPLGDEQKSWLRSIVQPLVQGGKFQVRDEAGNLTELDLNDVAQKLGLKMRNVTAVDVALPSGPSAPPGTVPGSPAPGSPPVPGAPPVPKAPPVPEPPPAQAEGASLEAPSGSDPMGEFRRALTANENRTAMREFKVEFGRGEETFRTATASTLKDQVDDLVRQVGNAWDATGEGRMRAIQNYAVRLKKDLADEVTNLLNAVMERGEEVLSRNYDLGQRVPPGKRYAWAQAKARQVVDEEANDVLSAARNLSLLGDKRDLSKREVVFNVRVSLGETVDSWIGTSGVFAVAEALSVSATEAVSLDPAVRFAQWSALLDEKVCKLCEWRDGQVIDKADPDFSRWAPPIHFGPCRCMWVPVRGDVARPTWKKTVPAGLMQFFQLGASAPPGPEIILFSTEKQPART